MYRGTIVIVYCQIVSKKYGLIKYKTFVNLIKGDKIL